MANKKIEDLTALGTTFGTADIFEISRWTGSAFVSRKITGSEISSSITGSNIGNSDLQVNSSLVIRQLQLGGSTTSDGFSIRNFADTDDLLTVLGDGQVWAHGKGSNVLNTAFGKGALDAQVSGDYCTAFGVNALTGVTTGDRNTGIGYGAGAGITTALYNTVIGFNAMTQGNTNNNTVIGNGALAFHGAAGADIVAIGSECLYNDGGLGQHVCIGKATGATGSTAIGNTSIGYGVHGSGGNSDYNTSVGWGACPSVVGDKNTTIGASANKYIGTGSTFCTSGDNGVFLGYDARPSGLSETNQIVIGYMGRGNGSNTATIGNSSIVGTFLQGAVVVGEYTVATLPTASTYQAGMIMVSDETGGYTQAFSDGTNWRRVQDRAIVS